MNVLLLKGEQRPLVDYVFAGSSMPVGITFTRASSATQINASGTVENAALDAPRFDYDPLTHTSLGLLYEPQKTNIAPYSVMSASEWQSLNTIKSSSTISAPDGTQNVVKFVDTATSANHAIYTASIVFGIGQPHVASVYARKGESKIIQVKLQTASFGADASANFDLEAGAVTRIGANATSATIQNSGDGFYRCAVFSTSTGAGYGSMGSLVLTNDDPQATTVPAYVGSGKGVYVWGYQLELAPLSSLIPASGAATTRAADQLGFVIPEGITKLRFVFDDNSTQDVSVSTGYYAVPTTLSRARIKRIHSVE